MGMIAQPTTPLKPQEKKIEINDLVGRRIRLSDHAQETAATPLSPPRDVNVRKSKSADQILRGVISAPERTHVPLLRRIHQEATASVAAMVEGGEVEERTDRGRTPGMPRRGVGFDGGLRRRGHRPTQRGKEQMEKLSPSKQSHWSNMNSPQRKFLSTDVVEQGSMRFDPGSKTCVVPPHEHAPGGQERPQLAPANRLDAPPLRGEMGRVPWKKWTPPYGTQLVERRPWQQYEESKRNPAEKGPGEVEVPLLSRPASSLDDAMNYTWFKTQDHRHVTSYFDTPMWSRAKEEVTTPFWMQPSVMSQSSTYGFPHTVTASTSRRGNGASLDMIVPSTSSTSSEIHPRLLRSLDNRELRHYLARAGVWSSEPLASCPRIDLLGLARQNISKLREVKKDPSYKECVKYGKPGSVADKYRVALRRSDKVGFLADSPKSLRRENSALGGNKETGSAREDPEDQDLIRDVEAAQFELEKSIEAVAEAKRKSEMARMRLALANGDPASALAFSRAGQGNTRNQSYTPNVFSLDQDEGDEEDETKDMSRLNSSVSRSCVSTSYKAPRSSQEMSRAKLPSRAQSSLA